MRAICCLSVCLCLGRIFETAERVWLKFPQAWRSVRTLCIAFWGDVPKGLQMPDPKREWVGIWARKAI